MPARIGLLFVADDFGRTWLATDQRPTGIASMLNAAPFLSVRLVDRDAEHGTFATLSRVHLTQTPVTTPEASTMALLGIGVAAVTALRWRHRKAQRSRNIAPSLRSPHSSAGSLVFFGSQ